MTKTHSGSMGNGFTHFRRGPNYRTPPTLLRISGEVVTYQQAAARTGHPTSFLSRRVAYLRHKQRQVTWEALGSATPTTSAISSP
jgi:hypothetical protein